MTKPQVFLLQEDGEVRRVFGDYLSALNAAKGTIRRLTDKCQRTFFIEELPNCDDELIMSDSAATMGIVILKRILE